jgi:N-hydroxyarylamine O-acetyltransferase
VSTDIFQRIDLDAYCTRVGYAGGRQPSLETLQALHLAHATHIPFENLDVLLGQPIKLDLTEIQSKLIRARRGGYCFEQNMLFAAVLEQFGFAVTRLAARVRLGAHRLLPRTHMLLLVKLEGVPWIADVGFGGWGLLQPIPLEADREVRQFQWSFRLRRERENWVLQCPQCSLGQDQYCFTLEPQLPVDYQLANYYCSTHPESRFVQTLTVQLPTPTQRYLLRNREFMVIEPTGTRTETLADDEELLRVLAERFGLRFPPGTVFRMASPALGDSSS